MIETDHPVEDPLPLDEDPPSPDREPTFEDFQSEVLVDLRYITEILSKMVEILDILNNRLSVIDSIKIPGWIKK